MFGQEAKLAALINRDPPQLSNELELVSELRAKLGPGADPDKLLFQIRSARGKTHWAVNSYLRDVMSSSAPGQEDFRPTRPARAAAAAGADAPAAAAAAAAAAATASPAAAAGVGAAAATIATPAVQIAASAPRSQLAEAGSSDCSDDSQGRLGCYGGVEAERGGACCAAGQQVPERASAAGQGSPSMTPFQTGGPAMTMAAAAAGTSDPAVPAVRALGPGADGGGGVAPASAPSVGRGSEITCREPCAPAGEGAGKEQRSACVGEAPCAALSACLSCCGDSAVDARSCGRSHVAAGTDGLRRSPPPAPAGSLPNVPPAAAAPAVPAPLGHRNGGAVGGDGSPSAGGCGLGGGADGGGGGVGIIVVGGLGGGGGGGVSGPSMDSLPVSLLEAVFRYLDYRSLSSAAMACKAMSLAASAESLWCGLYCARWGSLVFPTEPHLGAVLGAAAAGGGAAGGAGMGAAAMVAAAAAPQAQPPATSPHPDGDDGAVRAGSSNGSGAAARAGAATTAAADSDAGRGVGTVVGTGVAAPRPATPPWGQTPPRLQPLAEAEAALQATTRTTAAPAAAAAAETPPIDRPRPPPPQSPLARLSLLGRLGQGPGRAPSGPGPGAAADAAVMDGDVKVPLAVAPPRSLAAGPSGTEAATLGGLGPPPGAGAGTSRLGSNPALAASAAAAAQDLDASGVPGAAALRAAQAGEPPLATAASDGETAVGTVRHPGVVHIDGGSGGNGASQDGPCCPATPAAAAAGVPAVGAPQSAVVTADAVTAAGGAGAPAEPPAAPSPPPSWCPPPGGRYRCQYRSQMSFLTSLRCPRCGGGTIVPIVYGFPSPKLMEGMRARRLILGGDHLIENCHVWGCTRCGASYRHFPYDSCDVWMADLARQQQQQPQRPSHLPHYTYEL